LKKIYYVGIAIILILIVTALILIVRSAQNKTKKVTEGLLPEEVAEDQARVEEEKPSEESREESEEKITKELPKSSSSEPANSEKSSSATTSTTQKSAEPQYEYYMKQTQTVTIELPQGTEYSKTCSNNKCEIVIY